MSNTPYIPAITPFILPQEPFERLVAQTGLRLTWMKAHTCPCTQWPELQGTPDPACQTCQGRGTYWDPPVGPFNAFITFNPDPGAQVDPKWGLAQHAEPSLTLFQAAASGVYAQASINDAYVEVDSFARYNATIFVSGGGQYPTALPYQQGVTIAASGAVTVYDSVNHVVVPVSGYTVSGVAVTLPSGYAPGTPYTVEFQANPVYVAWGRIGALPHNRPFGGGVVSLPKRFRLMPLDIWTRARGPGQNTPQI